MALTNYWFYLTWNLSPSAISYNVRRSTTGGGPYTTRGSVTNAENYTDTGLAKRTTRVTMASVVAGTTAVSVTNSILIDGQKFYRVVGF